MVISVGAAMKRWCWNNNARTASGSYKYKVIVFSGSKETAILWYKSYCEKDRIIHLQYVQNWHGEHFEAE